MKVFLRANGKEIPVEISEDDYAALTAVTGYERQPHGTYWYNDASGTFIDNDEDDEVDTEQYDYGNYYSLESVARANARADKLMRQMRRFAALHGGCKSPIEFGYVITWSSLPSESFKILGASSDSFSFGSVKFASIEAATAAVKEFKEELHWYFTEYSPMPRKD